MNRALYDFFTKDHRRIETILEEATLDKHHLDADRYHQFRVGLLTHIKMEEKILFPAAQKGNGGELLPLQSKLRLDHGALTSLMACAPTPEVIQAVRYILEQHDILEEKEGGMYEACAQLTQKETQALLTELENVTPVPVHPVNDHPYVLEATKRAVARAGFNFEEISQPPPPDHPPGAALQ